MDSLKCLTPLDEALIEIKKRNEDAELLKKVEKYLNGDIPEYFQQKPILYLARHIATPNFETLRFLDICNNVNLPKFIGQDEGDVFSTHNTLKKNLGKLHIEIGKSKSGKSYIKNETIINFNTANNRKLKNIRTVWGEKLQQFHNKLLMKLGQIETSVLKDDTSWIDRNKRGNLVEHYKMYLSLFLTHGILFEAYEPQDKKFLREILHPAFLFVEKQFGLKPLIVNLIPEGTETDLHWISYPKEVLDAIKNARKKETNLILFLMHKIITFFQR